MDDDYELRIIKWARKYDGYARLARGPEHLWDLVQPLDRAFRTEGAIPEWAGVDLLRAWAFYLVRSHRHSGEWEPIDEKYPEFNAILDAIRRNPDVQKSDLPPEPTRP